jgi:uncharacterized protein (DUF3084 family)
VIKDFDAQFDSAIPKLNKEITQLDSAIPQLDSRINQFDSAIPELNKEITQLDSAIPQLDFRCGESRCNHSHLEWRVLLVNNTIEFYFEAALACVAANVDRGNVVRSVLSIVC